MPGKETDIFDPAIAIVGMAGRFPGAQDIASLWTLLHSGQEAIRWVDDARLQAAGIDPATLPLDYVRRQGILDHAKSFDAEFFVYSRREAALLDPQHRILLETAWTALEHAGYCPGTINAPAGVFASTGWPAYLLRNLAPHPDLLGPEFGQQTLLANEKDNLATRISFKLGLTGPSMTVQTACSSSLVAVCLAHQALLAFQCDIAIAGGVSLAEPQVGYLPQPGSILSPDGQCRAFDAAANGTVIGAGAAMVVLKRLDDAIADRDTIHAVLLGSAINNDGADKSTYTAPSADGQARVIADALAMAGIDRSTISYIEAHGTGTLVGDPIEIAGLRKAFGDVFSRAERTCRLGSLKTNIGHLDAAAGAAGLIKTTLMLTHRQIPPNLHFSQPNPHIDWAASGFEVNAELRQWEGDAPLRAGVSSFGLGGTNAHVVVEEPPNPGLPGPDCAAFLPISAISETALDRACDALAKHLEARPNQRLVDVAHTLLVGRKRFAFRRGLVCTSLDDAVARLREPQPPMARQSDLPANVAFMFPGQGSQHAGMGGALYRTHDGFRHHVDICLRQLCDRHAIDLLPMLLAHTDDKPAAAGLGRTENAQPALFVVEYALAQMWQDCGVRPRALIGHSLGEYVAACLAGVFSLEDAIDLVVARGRLMAALPAGAMLAVRLKEAELLAQLEPGLCLAAVNGMNSCVVSGSVAAIQRLGTRLAAEGVVAQELPTDRAFHSAMLEPMLDAFQAQLCTIPLAAPRVPFVSNLTGDWITDSEATSPEYWRAHVRKTVRFGEGLSTLLAGLRHDCHRAILMELGPGSVLTRIGRRALAPNEAALAALETSATDRADAPVAMEVAAKLWSLGVELDSKALYGSSVPRRIPLPTYQFERHEHWINPPASTRSLPDSDAWAAALRAAVDEANDLSEFDFPEMRHAHALLDQLCCGYAVRAIELLLAEQGDRRLPENLVRPDLVARWIELLTSKGQITLLLDGRIGALNAPSADEIAALLNEVGASRWIEPSYLALLAKCGDGLSTVMRGAQRAIELFASVVARPDERVPDAHERHRRRVLARAVSAFVASRSQNAPIRVLEVGGGSGIAASELLPILPADRTRYVFTDIATMFVTQAATRFQDYRFLVCQRLDLDQPFDQQGLVDGGFDIVVAVNVVHATRNSARSIDHIRRTLAPGGMLLLWEITEHSMDFDISYGLLMNPVEDDCRSRAAPFLSANEWRGLLLERGFVAAEPATLDMLGSTLLLARASEAEPSDNVPQLGLDKKLDIADWFYAPSWRRLAPLLHTSVKSCETWLLFSDECGVGGRIAALLRESGARVVLVGFGAEFAGDETRGFQITPDNPDHYARVLAAIKDAGQTIRIVHLWAVTVDRPTAATLDALWDAASLGLTSLVYLTQAIANSEWATAKISLSVVATHSQVVTGTETVFPEKALGLGACRVIPIEYPAIACRMIDIGSPRNEAALAEASATLFKELMCDAPPLVALRGRHRWCPAVEPIRLERSTERAQLRPKGVYLITGGLGMIGLTIAEWMAREADATVVLTTRREFPARNEWARYAELDVDATGFGTLIARILMIEARGGRVEVKTADVCDIAQMRRLVREVERSIGAINGVVHAAGLLGDGSIARKSGDDIARIVAPKAAGCIAIDAAFGNRPLDFLVLFSSLSAGTPGFGQVAYCAANAYLDAWVSSPAARSRGCVTSIGWDVWQGDGMAYSASAPSVVERIKLADFRNRGILPTEGIEVFRRVLGSGCDQLLVATSDYLQVLARRDKSMSEIYLELVADQPALVTSKPSNTLSRCGRALRGSEIEIAAIWAALLGTDDADCDDDFFDLGGDSLIATQVLNRIDARFGVQLTMKTFTADPTIAALARAIETRTAPAADDTVAEEVR